MHFIQFKKCLRSLSALRDYDTEKLSIKPAYIWSVLVVIFFVGLAVVFSVLFFLKMELSRREVSIVASSTSAIETLDETKMKSILIDRSKREFELETLSNIKPAVSDPGL